MSWLGNRRGVQQNGEKVVPLACEVSAKMNRESSNLSKIPCETGFELGFRFVPILKFILKERSILTLV